MFTTTLKELDNDNIFTATELSPDPYDPTIELKKKKGPSWWQRHGKKVQWIAFAVTMAAAVILMCIPGTQGFGVAMFMAGLKCAISGAIVGGAIGGVMSAAHQ